MFRRIDGDQFAKVYDSYSVRESLSFVHHVSRNNYSRAFASKCPNHLPHQQSTRNVEESGRLSNTAIFGRCARTLQSSTFFRIPPLINQVLLFLASQRSTARKTFSTRSSRSTLSRFVVIFKCQLRTSKAPSIPSTRGSWKAIPIIFLTSFGC